MNNNKLNSFVLPITKHLANVVLFTILFKADADCAGFMTCVASTCITLCEDDGECDGKMKCGGGFCTSECTANDNCDSG